MSDIFNDISKREQNLFDQLSICPVVEVIGLVGINGVGAGRTNNDSLWSMIVKFDAWRIGSGQQRTDLLTLRRKVSDEDLKVFQSKINAETVVKIHARVSDENIFGSPQALLEELIEIDVIDIELNNYLVELKKPPTYHDRVLGDFTFDRQVNWYTATVIWNDTPIRLNLSIDHPDNLDATIQVARTLWRDQKTWKHRISDYAVYELLPLKNESWLEEDEMDITAEQFKKRMSLESITVYSDGSFEFWHDDGDLFWGHSIQISGSLLDGPTDADIPG